MRLEVCMQQIARRGQNQTYVRGEEGRKTLDRTQVTSCLTRGGIYKRALSCPENLELYIFYYLKSCLNIWIHPNIHNAKNIQETSTRISRPFTGTGHRRTLFRDALRIKNHEFLCRHWFPYTVNLLGALTTKWRRGCICPPPANFFCLELFEWFFSMLL